MRFYMYIGKFEIIGKNLDKQPLLKIFNEKVSFFYDLLLTYGLASKY